MKLLVLNGENSDAKIEMKIDEYSLVGEIKNIILNKHEKEKNQFLKIIFKNIILNEDNIVKCYRLQDNDEIWLGKIEEYLKNDDVIIEVFLAGWTPDMIWLIVKMDDSISTIRSVISAIQPEIINIWNKEGHQMKNDQIVTEICSNQYYKLIVSCGDRNERNLTFNQCCNQHDHIRKKSYYFSRFHLFYFANLSWNNVTMTKKKNEIICQMNKIRRIISSNDTIDERLNENLSDFQSSYVDSNFLFCEDISYRIWNICDDYWSLIMDLCDSNLWNMLQLCFRHLLWIAVHDYSKIRRDYPLKSFNEIIIDTLDYLVKFSNDFSDDRKYMEKHCIQRMDSFLFICNSLSEYHCPLFPVVTITIMNGGIHVTQLKSNPQTIFECKKEIANRFGWSVQDLYCVNRLNHENVNDGDTFDERFVLLMVELMENIENFEVVKELARGSFGKALLCQHKISGNLFVIKKVIDVNSNLHRDIFINTNLMRRGNLLKHAGVIRGKNRIHLAMKYMSAGSLTDYIKQGKCLVEKEIVKISYQIIAQINELHKLDIIHSDIKPDNVVFDELENAKLIDFGLAKCAANLTIKDILEELKAQFSGTINYMAPELVKEELYSKKIDIWSFGMTMVEMVTGKCPFYWLDTFKIISKLKSCQKYQFESIMPICNNLKEYINSCLIVNPIERPTCQQLMEFNLFIDYLKKKNQ